MLPLPSNELERLKVLRRYAIFDTPPEAAFDRITRLAARLLKVPVALVTFIDEERQWFKSAYGTNLTENSRELSFCGHAILGEDIMVVGDATKDGRFSANAMVTGDPGIRFYAGAPLTSSDGFAIGTLCALDLVPREFGPEEREILLDLAAMTRDELELRVVARERVRQAAAIENLDSGVVLTDPTLPDNPIIFSNPGFSAITGYTFDESAGSNCRFLQGPESDPETIRALREAVAERRPFHGVILNYRKDGSKFWNELTITPVFGPEGELINFVGLQRDVTDRKRTADQLEESFDKLKKLEVLRDNLTHMIIHDLRSPLSSIVGFLDLLRMAAAAKLAPEELRFVGMAQKGAAALQEMISSLLDVNRLEAGEMPLQLATADLSEIVREATESAAALRGEAFLVRDLPNIPAAVCCDVDLIRRVIANLVSNAVKFTPEHGRVRITIAPDSLGVRVSVIDTGPGIPLEYQARIFEKFGQVESRKYQNSTGLGLTFCKLAVEAHGGVIGLDSVPGKGSTFWFALPCA